MSHNPTTYFDPAAPVFVPGEDMSHYQSGSWIVVHDDFLVPSYDYAVLSQPGFYDSLPQSLPPVMTPPPDNMLYTFSQPSNSNNAPLLASMSPEDFDRALRKVRAEADDLAKHGTHATPEVMMAKLVSAQCAFLQSLDYASHIVSRATTVREYSRRSRRPESTKKILDKTKAKEGTAVARHHARARVYARPQREEEAMSSREAETSNEAGVHEGDEGECSGTGSVAKTDVEHESA